MLFQLSSLISHFAAAPTSQASCDASRNSTFLGLETWYKYLTVQFDSVTQSCKITSFDPTGTGKQTTQNVLGSHSPFLLIGLAVIDDLLRIAALVAIGFIFVGAFKYMTSQGNPDAASNAQTTIIDALIGLAISIIAIGAVSFIGSKLAG